MIDEKNEKPENITDGNPNQPEPDKKPNRRSFLKTTGAAAAGLALGHFILVGGSKKAWATVADCASQDADHCPSPANPLSDTCSTNFPDTCSPDGGSGDECGYSNNSSVDVCYPANPGTAYDSCELTPSHSLANPDVCGPKGSPNFDGDECGPASGYPEDLPDLN